MIVLFTDFGLNGPYVGQMSAVLAREAPGIAQINLFADAPLFNPRASAHLLAAFVDEFEPGTVFLSVVDPGVGSARDPVVVQADGRWFVGPDNGLFDVLGARARTHSRWRIAWRPPTLSHTFHGRDLFAPVAASIARTGAVPSAKLEALERPLVRGCDDLYELIYLDHYGNAMSGIRAVNLPPESHLGVHGQVLRSHAYFSQASADEPFWYANANGLVEIALNRGSARERLNLQVGDVLERL